MSTAANTRCHTIWTINWNCKRPHAWKPATHGTGGRCGRIVDPSLQWCRCIRHGPSMWPITMECCWTYVHSVGNRSSKIQLQPVQVKYWAYYWHGWWFCVCHITNGIWRVHSISSLAFYRVLNSSFPKQVRHIQCGCDTKKILKKSSTKFTFWYFYFELNFFNFFFFYSWICLVPEQMYVICGMTVAMLAKMATTCSQTVLVAGTGELMPLAKQKLCIFSCIVWARIWLLTAPFIGVITYVHNLLPMAAFGLLGAIGGICTCIINHYNRQQKEVGKHGNGHLHQSDIYVIDKSASWHMAHHRTSSIHTRTHTFTEWLLHVLFLGYFWFYFFALRHWMRCVVALFTNVNLVNINWDDTTCQPHLFCCLSFCSNSIYEIPYSIDQRWRRLCVCVSVSAVSQCFRFEINAKS